MHCDAHGLPDQRHRQEWTTRPAEQGVAKPLRCERCQIGDVFLSVLGNNEFQNEAKHLRCLETLYRRRQTGGTQGSVPVVAAEIAELREVILFQAFIRIINAARKMVVPIITG